MGLGLGALRFYKRKKKIILPKKEELDKITSLYNIKYEFSTKISSDILGNETADSILKIDDEILERSDNIAMLSTTR
jgi:endonuclease III-like uncharacterized protein